MLVARGCLNVALPLLLSLVVGAEKQVSVKETVFDSAVSTMRWLGNNSHTVLVQTLKGRLYRSANQGDTWTDITDSMRQPDPGNIVMPSFFKVEQIVVSPADRNTVMVAGSKRQHYLSTNAGATWRELRQKSTIHTVIFHKTRPKWALLSTWTESCSKRTPSIDEPCNHMLYVTKDMGRSFALVTSYVVQFSWGDALHGQQDRIYFTHFRSKKGDQPKLTVWSREVDFAFVESAGATPRRLVFRGNKFLVSHGFIFVAKLKDSTSQNVNLMVSSNAGTSFAQAQLPQELEEKSYTILDTSEGAVMLHVNHGNKGGNVYKSDASGVKYVLTLQDNVRSSSGDCEFDKVLSLDGVYLANIKESTADAANAAGDGKEADESESDKDADELESGASATQVDKRKTQKSKGKDETAIRTVITFDKGGVWSYLKPPRVDSVGKTIDCPPERCFLHLHGITNFHNYAPFYSIENAIGLIMGTGNVGPALRFEPDVTNTYLSRDGGLTWHEAHKGAFIYEFADHGGLVVMADDMRKTKQVVFSWNEGQSWYDFELSQFPMEVDNIVTEWNATSTKLLLYGTRGDAGVVYHLNFETLGQPLCKGVWAADSVASDYETWTPSDGKSSEGCQLGRQVTYTRRKPTSECFNGESFERPVTRKNCVCTQEDYECEVGFSRQIDSMECRHTDYANMNVPEKCSAGQDVFYAPAYRKVIGDSCEGGWASSKVQVPCPGGAKLSNGAMSVMVSLAVLGAIFVGINHLAASDSMKGFFNNYGFDSHNNVKYAQIGNKGPDHAMDNMADGGYGRFDMAADDDDDDRAPPLSNARDRDRERRDDDRDRDRDRDRARGVDTAAASVPKLQAPPGGGAAPLANEDDGIDLL